MAHQVSCILHFPYCLGCDVPDFLLLILQTVFYDLLQGTEMGQNGTTHQNGDVLDGFDARMACLPALFALTDRLQERQQGWNAQGGRHHRKGPGGGVPSNLVHIVDIGTHSSYHGCQARRLCQVGDDLPTFNSGVVLVVWIDQQRLDRYQYLVHIRSDQVIQRVLEGSVEEKRRNGLQAVVTVALYSLCRTA